VVHREAEVSFWIDAAEHGHGLAFEAATEVITFAFHRLGLNRLCAYHMVRNAASARLLQRLGFQREGRLRERVWKDGRFEDVFLLSRLTCDQ
jgi:RimJ/RimL family protein N-acetyltransferase